MAIPWKGSRERVKGPWLLGFLLTCLCGESCCLGVQHEGGGKEHLRLNMSGRPIAKKYREGKMKSNLERWFKDPEIG